MSELRQDPTTYDWVIIAKDRAKRPHDFKENDKDIISLPEHNIDCPFCPGNEHKTPKEEAVYVSDDNWRIRVVPNKFPALTPAGDTKREQLRLFRKTHGYGKTDSRFSYCTAVYSQAS